MQTITKSGAGALLLGGVNSFTAGAPGTKFQVNAGSLVAVGQNDAGPATGPLGGAPLALNNGTLVLASTSAAPVTFDMVSGNAVTLSGNNDSIIAGSTLAGVANGAITLAGSNQVPIAAGQTLNLGAANGYALNLSSGLVFSNSGTISAGPGSVSLSAINLTTSAGTLSASAGGTLVLPNNMAGITATYAPASGGTVQFSGDYQGAIASLLPAAGGTLLFAGSTSMSGTLNVAGGAFVAGNPNSFGSTTLQINGGSLGALRAVSVSNPLVWGAMRTLNFGGSSLLTLSASLGLAGGNSYTVNDAGAHGNLAGVISGGGTLNITGNPTLSATNTYTGGTVLSGSASPILTNNLAFSTGLLTFNNGGFQAGSPLTGANAVANPWTIPAGAAAYFGGGTAFQLSSSAALSGSQAIHITNPGLTVTLSGLISGAGTLTRATDTANQVNGTLVINNPGNTFSGGFVLQSYGGNVDVQGASTTPPSGTVTSGPLGSGPITLGNNANNAYFYLMNSSATPVTLANALNIYDIGGFASLSGLTLAGATTLTGPSGDNAGIAQIYLGAANSNVTLAGTIAGNSAANGLNLRQGAGSGGLTLERHEHLHGPDLDHHGHADRRRQCSQRHRRRLRQLDRHGRGHHHWRQ